MAQAPKSYHTNGHNINNARTFLTTFSLDPAPFIAPHLSMCNGVVQYVSQHGCVGPNTSSMAVPSFLGCLKA